MGLLDILFRKNQSKSDSEIHVDVNNIELSLHNVILAYNEIWKDHNKWKTNLNLAETALRKLIMKHPKNTFVLTNLGAILSDQGKHQDALIILKTAESLGSEDSNLFLNIAIAKMSIEKQRPSAKGYFDKANKFKASNLTIKAYFDPHAH